MSRSSSNKIKYVYNPTQTGAEDAKNSDNLISTTDMDLTMSSPQPDRHVMLNNSNISTRSVDKPSAKDVPAVSVSETQSEKREKAGGWKEMQLQSLSQLSLSSTPVKGRREETVRVKKRLPQSSIPVVKNTEHRGRILPIKSLRKPPHSMPVLPKKKERERQPLIPSKGEQQYASDT